MSLPRFINKQYFLVRISREAQKQRREKIGSILLHANQVFMQRNMQYGEIVKIGSRPYPCPASAAEWLPEAELGDDLLFHHSVEGTMDDRNSDERQRYERFKFLLFQDDQWRYYLVNYNQAYAVVKRDGSIFTTQDWVIGDPYKAPPPEGVSTDDHGRELLQTDSGLVLFANYKPPDQLCAFTLENTAFYDFIVAQNGYSILNIQNIECSNKMFSAGFQVGFFTGSCTNLQWLDCSTGSTYLQNGFVQFTSPYLYAGQHIWIAIDGTAGSRCTYGVSVTNSVPLSLWNNAIQYYREFTFRVEGKTFHLVNTRNLKTHIEVYDILGRQLLSRQVQSSFSFGSQWAGGVYLVLVNGYPTKWFKQ